MQKEEIISELRSFVEKYKQDNWHQYYPGFGDAFYHDAVAAYVAPLKEEISRLKEAAGLKISKV